MYDSAEDHDIRDYVRQKNLVGDEGALDVEGELEHDPELSRDIRANRYGDNPDGAPVTVKDGVAILH